MFLSKIWFVLVGLLASVSLAAAFVAPRAADRRILELEGQRLDRAQYAAEQMLKADAHNWIDYAAKLSRDAILAESLESASKGSGETRLVQATVQRRLGNLVPDLGRIGLTSVGAVDAKGNLVARLGPGPPEGAAVGGLEVLADALRGYLSDDVWGAGGRLERVAAVPVLSKARDKIVGALYVGAETGQRLAEVWKRNLGVEIALLLRGDIHTSTLPDATLGTLPALIEQRTNEINEAKRTRPLTLDVGNDKLLAVAAPFVGEAAAQGGIYVLIGKMSPTTGPLALLGTTTAEDLSWGNFPWLGLGIGLVVILGVGLFLQRHEVEQPIAKLRVDAQRLGRGEIEKLNDTQYAGKLGGIARDVNAAMERFTLAPPHKSEVARVDLGAVLGPPPSEPSSVFDLPQSHFGFGGEAGSGPSFPGMGAPLGAPPFGGAGAPPPPPAMPMGAGGFPSAPSPPAAAPIRGRSNGPMAPAVSEPWESSDRMASAKEEPTAAIAGHQLRRGVPAGSGPAEYDQAMGGDDAASFQTHVLEVFTEYVSTRERCGEAVGSLTLEKFRAKLEANRQQLMSKYGCRSARFSVYVKDGKAAIKATPVR